MLIVALALQAAAPTAEALELGRRLADTGSFVSVLRLAARREVADLAAEDAAMSADDRRALDRIGAEESDANLARVADALGRGYAERLSVTDMRALIAQNEDSAAVRFRAVQPEAIVAAMASLGEIDFKDGVAARVCAERRRLCGRD